MSDTPQRLSPDEIRVERAGPRQKPLMQQLWQFYVHDMSETMGQDVDEQGRFSNLPESWWKPGAAGNVFLFLIRAAGRPAGFAVVARPPHAISCSDPDFIMVEFFVLRKWRRKGVASAAARSIFDRLRGRWEVSEGMENAGAVAFWRKLLGEYCGGEFREESLKLGQHDGVAQIFDNASEQQ